MKELFFELGTEEIPARLVERARVDLAKAVLAGLEAAHLTHGPMTSYATPRRLALVIQVAESQEDVTQEMLGPPARVAFDESGAPTRAALAFAQRHGLDPADLEKKATPKGDYLAATIFKQGQTTLALAPGILADATRGLKWPKAMAWNRDVGPFIRPIHWLVALFGGEILDLSIMGVQAGNKSRGHRFMAPHEFEVSEGSSWCASLRAAYVEPDPDIRTKTIQEEATALADSVSGEIVMDAGLLGELTYLSEWPVALLGAFEEDFLQIPSAVLITSMKVHQKYVAITQDGALSKHFIIVAGLPSSHPATVVAGNQRVLAARLSDARFFFEADKKHGLDAFVEALSRRIYLKGLGTMADKATRLADLAGRLASELGASGDQVAEAKRAGWLAKADLSSKMVGEFASLQGHMGRRYAQLAGEAEEVCAAIEEHYFPKHATDILPTDLVSLSVALADRLDALTGCFALGLEPTGSADPYALRRGALGVIRILADTTSGLRPLGLGRGLDLAREVYGDVLELDWEAVKGRLLVFFRGRLKHFYAKSFPIDLTEAVLASDFDRPADVEGRLSALSRVKSQEGWDDLAIAVKRVVRIVTDQEVQALDPQSLVGVAETALYEAFSSSRAGIQEALDAGDYDHAIEGLIGLKPHIDRFFDDVMVMSDDLSERHRRLALLTEVGALFGAMASFDKVST